jgi:trans-aconitate 2-methyltransferase
MRSRTSWLDELVFDLYCYVMTWDPTQYLRYGDERSRPFFELVARIIADDAEVRSVVDLGCGPGNLTETLATRWPAAHVLGVDNDAAMLAAAASTVGERVRYESGDIATWTPSVPVDVLVSNAAFQWVLSHLELLPTLLTNVRPGGWFAFQVPGNLDDPHHQAIREVRARTKWASMPTLAALPFRTHVSYPASTYLDVLTPLCSEVDAWETSYVHILQGANPILDWVKGTGLRPVLSALDTDDLRAEFCAELAPLLGAAYPQRDWGTPFPFKRVFVVARRA